jgi:hypothetical protein
MKGEEMKGEKKPAALMLAHLISTPFQVRDPISGAMLINCAIMRAAGLFSPFISSPFIKSWISIFLFVQHKLHAFGMALLVAASSTARKRRG